MKANYINFRKPVVAALCNYCHKTVIPGASRTVLDDNGSLAITAWTCGKCGSVNEEIGILSEDGQVIPRPRQYVVAPHRRLLNGMSRSGSHVQRCRIG
jgi:hypothetical protein